MVGVTGENHLGDGAGLAFAALDFKHSLVPVGVETPLTERGLDACDTVPRESVLQGSFAGSDPGQEVLQCLVLIR